MKMSEANEKRWVIIATKWGGDALHGTFIPDKNRPTIFHASREVAEAELLRLEQKHRRDFALFEAVAYARRVGGESNEQVHAFVVESISS